MVHSTPATRCRLTVAATSLRMYSKKCISSPQQTPLQKCLHVTTSVHDQEDKDVFLYDSVNDAVGFEKISRYSRIPSASNSFG